MSRAAMKLPYPQNLVCDVMGGSVPADALPPDLEASVGYVLENLMDQCEAFMLVLRYMHGLTCREIGEYYGLSSQQCRQVIDRALRRIRHPLRFKCLKDGIAQTHPLPPRRENSPPLGMAPHGMTLPDIRDTFKKYKRYRQLRLTYPAGQEPYPSLQLGDVEIQAGHRLKVRLPDRWEVVTIAVSPEVAGPDRWYISTPGFQDVSPIGLFVEI